MTIFYPQTFPEPQRQPSIPREDYPVSAFPEKMQKAILEQRYNNEAAMPMIACSLIGAVSGAVQDKVDVEKFSGSLAPPIIFTLVIADSGGRKSTVDRSVMKVFDVFEAKVAEILGPKVAVLKARALKWRADIERIEMKLKGKDEELDDDKRDELQAELEDLMLNKPTVVSIPRLRYRDVTPEALAKGLKNWPSGILNSSESGGMMAGRTLSNQPMFNLIWDGEDIWIDRASKESIVIRDPRLTVCMMVQAKTFQNFLQGKGFLSRDNGFLARFLVCYPERLEGSRFGAYSTGTWEHLDAFHERIMEILMEGIPSDEAPKPRPVLKLSMEARAVLKQFADLVEADLAQGEYLGDVTDAGSKLAENVVRLAALFHYFEGRDGEIDVEMVLRAKAICAWHMIEFKRLFAPEPVAPPEFQDARALEEFLHNASRARPGQQVPKKYLYTYGPYALRGKGRLDMALAVLCQEQKIQLQSVGKRIWVVLNPYFFPAVNQVGYLPPILPPTVHAIQPPALLQQPRQ